MKDKIIKTFAEMGKTIRLGELDKHDIIEIIVDDEVEPGNEFIEMDELEVDSLISEID